MELVGNQYKIRLTSKFGEISPVRDYRPHTGIDLAIPEATKLHSIVDGKVERVITEANNSALGNGVIIRGEDGKAYIYGHLKEVNVTPGQNIEMGQFLGLSGNTGNSTAAHLHFGIQEPNGEFIDPAPLADTVADLTGNQSANFLDNIRNFFKNGQPDQYDKGENIFLDYLMQKVGDGLIYIWEWFVSVLPEIAGYITILAGIVIIIGSMVKRGGAIKVLLGYAAFLILALCILMYQ